MAKKSLLKLNHFHFFLELNDGRKRKSFELKEKCNNWVK